MPDFPSLLAILPLFFLVAFVYSSVGHGGASGYLALFALFGMASPAVAPIALLLNIVVASTGWWRYSKEGFFSWQLLLPFVATSVPAAFIGGLMRISPETFSLLLGIALLWASLRLLLLGEVKAEAGFQTMARDRMWKLGLPIGAGLGLLSGMVGIGGGIFLSPLILLLGLADAKRTAAISAGFIVLNSTGGLVGHLIRANVDFASALPLVVTVLAGGLLGSYTGAVRFQPRILQFVLAFVLVIAGGKLLSRFF